MIRIEGLNVSFEEFQLRDIDLHIAEHQFFVLMGPTGAGKTVLLEALAGLIPLDSGRIFLGDREITHLPPERRGIGIVYQDYALFPHMTVQENITYGLHFHSVSSTVRRERFSRYVDRLNLAHLLGRHPETLSGGELQRTALARALMIEPAVLLLDEPLSSLDPAFRQEIQELLRRIHESSRITMLMVTHDFVEAVSLAERAAVVNNGRIEQVDTIENIFRRPRTRFVADFTGMKNFFPVVFEGSQAKIGSLHVEMGRRAESERGFIAIRPEDIVLSVKPLASSMRNCFQGRIIAVVDRGFFYEVSLDSQGTVLHSLVTKGALVELEIEAGRNVFISFKATAVHSF
jgi:molybdate/tungstate transport system ATP-binding protein